MIWRRRKRNRTYLYAGQSNIGLVRAENQDSFGIFKDGSGDDRELLFVVADGMGGHDRGREASMVAVKTVRERFFESGDEPLLTRLRESFEEANRRVRECAISATEEVRMGTTCTALALGSQTSCIGHIGDSRAYLISRSSVRQLTLDHTVAEELHREGVLTSSEASAHPSRNMLRRALGIEDECSPDVFLIDPPRVNDRIVLCSDGLGRVSKDEIADIARRTDPETACTDLIDLAKKRGGHDNVTVLLVAVR
ncbi:MAG: protein phosphatase 2C domain-containing protein [Rhodothermia bacterium]|nr:protein phosphatase 2C domain-containing protein [Rhodothermia bacterium]